MKTEITVQQNQMAVVDIMTMAKTFAESGMFADTRQAAQAFVKIQAGQEIGIAPFQAMSGIHIIQGKPAIGAGIMASKIKGSGKYDYRVTQQDEKACSIDFFQGKEKIGTSTFTIEDAKKAQTKNIDKFPKNMLFARAISNGLKWYCPDVFSGPVYVPEEMQFTEDVAHVDVTVTPEALPLITKKMYGQLLDRLKKGERDIIDKAKVKYSFSDEQLEEVDLAEQDLEIYGVPTEVEEVKEAV